MRSTPMWNSGVFVMLLSLAQWLQTLSPEWGFLRVFQYITFRAVMAAMTALLMGLTAGPWVIRHLTSLKIGQPVRSYGMATHLAKSGTPTMGGVLILLSIATSTLLWFDLSNRFVWIVLVVTLGFGAIGWVDDWRKVVHKDPEGMRSREKYFWQSVIGLLAALYLVFSISENSNLRVLDLFVKWILSGFDVSLPPKAGLFLPFFKEVSYPLGVLGFVIMTYLVIVGASNAVNLTDGLDGFAGGDGGLGAGCVCLCHWQLCVLALPIFSLHSRLGGVADLLRRHGGRRTGLFVVQHPSRASLHGRCRCLGFGGRSGHDCGHCPSRNCAGHHGRYLCGRGDLGHGAGELFQIHQEEIR